MPMEMLILMIFNSEGHTISVDDFKILAVIPSFPIALDASSEPMLEIKSGNFIKDIWNFTFLGNLEST